MIIRGIAALAIFLLCVSAEGIANLKELSKSCPSEISCGKVNATDAICRLDDSHGCIRKYASKCHLDIAACVEGKKYSDYSDVYCSMETYICEENETYERWTIFFGHEKD